MRLRIRTLFLQQYFALSCNKVAFKLSFSKVGVAIRYKFAIEKIVMHGLGFGYSGKIEEFVEFRRKGLANIVMVATTTWKVY